MPGYRLYFMERFSGHIEQAREFAAQDDAAAIAIAEQSRDNRPMELWRAAHKVRYWDARPITPPA